MSAPVTWFEISSDNSVALRERIGGRTVVPITVVPDLVTFAHFADPEGNVIGLTKSS